MNTVTQTRLLQAIAQVLETTSLNNWDISIQNQVSDDIENPTYSKVISLTHPSTSRFIELTIVSYSLEFNLSNISDVFFNYGSSNHEFPSITGLFSLEAALNEKKWYEHSESVMKSPDWIVKILNPDELSIDKIAYEINKLTSLAYEFFSKLMKALPLVEEPVSTTHQYTIDDVLFESTQAFEDQISNLNPQDKEIVIEKINECASLFLNDQPSLYSQLSTLPIPPLRYDCQSSLYILEVLSDLSIILTLDEDPIFEQIVITLFRLVKPNDLEKAYQDVAESLYYDLFLEQQETANIS